MFVNKLNSLLYAIHVILIKWLFSLWNEPDSPREMFGIGTCAQYFDFYKATFQVVKSCNPNLVFGSPSTLPTRRTLLATAKKSMEPMPRYAALLPEALFM